MIRVKMKSPAHRNAPFTECKRGNIVLKLRGCVKTKGLVIPSEARNLLGH